LAALIAAGHLAALSSVWLVLPAAAAALASLGLGLSWAGFRRLQRSQPSALIVGPEATLRIVDRDGEIQQASISEARVPVWWLATLRMTSDEGRRNTVLLLPDSTDAEALRRLRGWILGPAQRRADRVLSAKATGTTKDPGPA
jgi:hypothetical protein